MSLNWKNNWAWRVCEWLETCSAVKLKCNPFLSANLNIPQKSFSLGWKKRSMMGQLFADFEGRWNENCDLFSRQHMPMSIPAQCVWIRSCGLLWNWNMQTLTKFKEAHRPNEQLSSTCTVDLLILVRRLKPVSAMLVPKQPPVPCSCIPPINHVSRGECLVHLNNNNFIL